jgi:Mg2+ and Co2+ transporter CorA
MSRALLFEQDAVEEVRDWPDRLPEIPASSVLWIDLESPTDDELEQLAGALDLSRQSVKLLQDRQHETPCFRDFESYLHVSAQAPLAFGDLALLTCLVGEHWASPSVIAGSRSSRRSVSVRRARETRASSKV